MRGFTAGLLLLMAATLSQGAEKAGKYTNLGPKERPTAAAQPARPGAHAPTGSLTFYTDRATFDAAHPGIPLETYANVNIPPNSVLTCPGPIDNLTNNGCFSPGDILPGVSVVNTTAGDNVVLTPPFFGVNCVAVGPNTFTDDGEIVFNPPVFAVGLDLNSNVPDTYNIEVFGPAGSLGTTTTPAQIPALFWGVDTVDAGGISRITFVSPAGSGELFCNVAFGFPVPVELQGFDVQ